MNDTDPERVARRLTRASEGLAEVRHAVEAVSETLDGPLSEAEARVAQGQQETAWAANLAEDVAARRVQLAAVAEASCLSAATLAATVDDADLRAAQLTALIDRIRAGWEAELTARQHEVSALSARSGAGKRGEEGGREAELRALTERIRCAQAAVARCREAAGVAALAALAVSRADDDLQTGLARVEDAEGHLEQVAAIAGESSTHVDAARQAVLSATDHLAFAKRSLRETAEATSALSSSALRAERGLDDAAEQLSRIDRGQQP